MIWAIAYQMQQEYVLSSMNTFFFNIPCRCWSLPYLFTQGPTMSSSTLIKIVFFIRISAWLNVTSVLSGWYKGRPVFTTLHCFPYQHHQHNGLARPDTLSSRPCLLPHTSPHLPTTTTTSPHLLTPHQVMIDDLK